MGIERCSSGLHYYDSNKYERCPYCDAMAGDDPKTIAMKRELPVMEDVVTISGVSKDFDDVKTIGVYSKSKGNDYVSGWLVCVEGAERGRDYRIYQGRNFVGRETDMDICIQGDTTISRKNHCAVVYDERNNQFFIMPMENSVYLEDSMINGAVPLIGGQKITIGNSIFVFIPFCVGERKWIREE